VAKAILDGEKAERRRVKAREWYARNGDRRREQAKAWHIINGDKRREQAKAWYRANREHRLAQNAAWKEPRKAELEARAKVVRDTPKAIQAQKDRNARWYDLNRAYAKKQAREWQMQNPRKRKNNRLKYAYGITIETYEEMYSAQNGKCCICNDAYPALYVDHNHKTEAVRGLLCARCNTGLGFFRDSHKMLHLAAAYLRKYK